MKQKLSLLIVLIFIATLYIGCNTSSKKKNNEKEVIKIGAILPLTGPASIFADYIKKGLDLAIENFNKDNDNPKLVLIYEDCMSNPKDAITAYIKVTQVDKVDIIIAALSSVNKALAPLAEKDKKVLIGTATSFPEFPDLGKYMVRVYPNADGLAGIMARYSSTKLERNRAAIVYINDEFGLACNNIFKNAFEENGGEVILDESFEMLQKDFKDIILKIKGAKPDCIYLGGYGLAYTSFVKQLIESQLDFNYIFTADMTLGLPTTISQIGSIIGNAYFVDSKMNKEFVKNFQTKYNELPSSYSGYAYDIIGLVNSISDKDLFNSNSLATDVFIDKLLKTKYFGVMDTISFQENGECNLQFQIKKIEEGVIIENL